MADNRLIYQDVSSQPWYRYARGRLLSSRSGIAMDVVSPSWENEAHGRREFVSFPLNRAGDYRTASNHLVERLTHELLAEPGTLDAMVEITRQLSWLSSQLHTEDLGTQGGTRLVSQTGVMLASYAHERSEGRVAAESFDDLFALTTISLTGVSALIRNEAFGPRVTGAQVAHVATTSSRRYLVGALVQGTGKNAACPATRRMIEVIADVVLAKREATDFSLLPISEAEIANFARYRLAEQELVGVLRQKAYGIEYSDLEELIEQLQVNIQPVTAQFAEALKLDLRSPTIAELYDDPLFAGYCDEQVGPVEFRIPGYFEDQWPEGAVNARRALGR